MITLTEQAQTQIKSLLNKRRLGKGIRIGVKTTGCSGLAYVLEYLNEDKFDPTAERIVYQDFIVQIYTKDVVYLRGLVVDYVKNGLNEGFEFLNPNERDRCGCGESFRI
jgi:iron-sulfur cluster assembly protein